MPSVCSLSNGRNFNILGTVWCVKLEITELVLGMLKLTQIKYLHPIATASAHTTTTATKVKVTIINSAATTTTAATKTKGIEAKNL